MTERRVVLGEYFVTETKTLLFIVRADFEQPWVTAIDCPVAALRNFATSYFGTDEADTGDTTPKARKMDLAEWHRLMQPLVEPLLQWVAPGDILWLVPHDLLHYLPFHAALVEGHYLIERNPICYTPSASVMKYCKAKRTGKRNTALVVGDSLGDRMHAHEEALTVARIFGTTPFLQGEATKPRVKAELASGSTSPDIVHFSCHSYFDYQQALKSGIVLSASDSGQAGAIPAQSGSRPDVLTAEEIFGLKMSAELVTLSGCETGVNQRRPGDELLGLTRALIYAGTPSVLVTLWKVEDLSTGMLMRYFYEQLRDSPGEDSKTPTSKVVALQSAQLYVKNIQAGEVIEYCNRGLSELAPSGDVKRIANFLTSRANIHAQVSNLAEARNDYHAALSTLNSAYEEHWASDLTDYVARGLQLVEMKANLGRSTSPDYTSRPFEHPYYWAPFALVGDWR